MRSSLAADWGTSPTWTVWTGAAVWGAGLRSRRTTRSFSVTSRPVRPSSLMRLAYLRMLCPPKPRELERTRSTSAWMATLGTLFRSQAGSGSSRLMVGGRMDSFRAFRQAMASTAPAAPSMWPVMDLVELMVILRARSSPSAFLIASVSMRSFMGVPVPWALK